MLETLQKEHKLYAELQLILFSYRQIQYSREKTAIVERDLICASYYDAKCHGGNDYALQIRRKLNTSKMMHQVKGGTLFDLLQS